jgi:hypothetical protein
VVRALHPDRAGALEEARERRVPYLLVDGRLDAVGAETGDRARLEVLLAAGGEA